MIWLLLLLLCACEPDKPAPPAPDTVDAWEVVDPYGDNEEP